MNGQYSLFDYQSQKHRPCDYRFKRYIGQKVHIRDYIGEITEIESYYTTIYVEGHGEFVGTPTTMYPVEREDDD